MKYIIFPLWLLMMGGVAAAQTAGEFKSHQSGNWNVTSTWDQWDGSAWINPALNIPAGNSGIITIQPDHIISIAASITAGQLIVNEGGHLVINAGRTLTIVDDGTPAIDLLVAGELTVDGILATLSGSTVTNSGTLIATAPEGSPVNNSTNLVIEGNFVNDGIIDLNVGTIVFTGDSTTLTGASASTFLFSMRIDSGSTVISNIPLTIRNTFTVSGSGIFLANQGADASLFGNLSVTGIFVSNATIVFPDTTTITGVGSKSFNDVLITGVLTPSSAYAITGNLSLSGNGTLRAGNSTTTFSGNTVFSNSGTSPVSFYNITIPSSATPFSLTATADLTILGGTLRWNNGTFNSTAEITFGRAGTTRLTGTGLTTFNRITVTAGTTFRPNIPCTVTGNVVINGIWIASNTITFGGFTTLSTTGTPTISFNHIAIGNGNSLTTYSGTVTVNGNFINNGTFDPNRGTIAFAGNTAKKISGGSLTQFNNINVSNGTAGIDLSVESNSSMMGILTMAANAYFDADGAANSVIFTLLSSGDNPTVDASIAMLPAGAVVQGNVTVQRYVSIEGPNGHRVYRYISSPVSNAPVSDLQNEIPVTGTFSGRSSCEGCGTSPSMFWYDETLITGGIKNGYNPFPSASNAESLVPGRGYAVFVRGNINPVLGAGSAKFDLRGIVNAGTIDFPVTFTSSGIPAEDGWNLVGNPYPSAIDWNASTGWTKTNLGGSIYMLDNGVNPSRYAVWNGTVGTNGGSQTIAAGQGFFLQATGPAPVLISDENVKVATSTAYFRLAEPTHLLRIGLSQGTLRDETVIHFRDSASLDFDSEYDAIKFKNLLNGNSNTPFLNLSTVSRKDDHKLTINSMPPLDCLTGTFNQESPATVMLDVSDVPIGSYTLDFSNLESFSSTTDIILKDYFMNPTAEVDLRRHLVYVFQVTSSSLSFGSERFQLFFSDHNLAMTDVQIADVCKGQESIVLVTNSQPGINYFVEKNGMQISPVQAGTGALISLPINQDSLTIGINKLNVWAQSSSCSNLAASRPDSIRVVDIYSINQVSSIPSCQAGAVTITATGAPEEGYYNWYERKGDLAAITNQSSSVFTTPILTQSKTFYVAAVNALGCEGERSAAAATILNYSPATITQVDQYILQSNYESGNHWYCDDQLLGDTTALLGIKSSGLYRLEVNINGCVTSDEQTFAVTGLRGNMEDEKFYPNPVSGVLYVELEDEKDHTVDLSIVNAIGEEVGRITLSGLGTQKKGQIDFSTYRPGLYFIPIPSARNVSLVKIVKK